MDDYNENNEYMINSDSDYDEDNSLNTEPSDSFDGEAEAPALPVVRDKSFGDIKKFIVMMCVICAVVGGVVGGCTVGIFMKSDNNDTSQTQTVTEAQQATQTTVATTQAQTEKKTDAATETTTASAVLTTAENNESVDMIQSGTYTSSDDKPSEDKTYSAKEIYENNVESVVSIVTKYTNATGYGTGFIISEDGYIVTNYHVVDGADACYVTLYNDEQYTAEIIGYEDSNDIAVIKIEPKGEIHSLVYGNSSELLVGDPVYVIGNPLGDLTFTLTDGVVSALNRLIETDEGILINMFQTNAAVNSGNSGGPVFDEHGYVVGIASAKYASSSIEGLSFCIPIDDVRSMIDEIINIGYVSGKPLMGVSVCDREVSTYGFIQSTRSINGAKIVAVGEGSAAEKYGLKTGDIIVKANGEDVTSVSSLKTILSKFRSGYAITITVNRDGEQVDLLLILDEYEPSEARTSYSYVYDI